MSYYNTAISMSAKGASDSGIVNDGATVVYGGNANTTSGPASNVPGKSIGGAGMSKYREYNYVGGTGQRMGNQRVNGSADFNDPTNTIVSPIISTTLGGVANTAIQHASAGNTQRPVNYSEARRYENIGSGIRNGGWNPVSGVFNPALISQNSSFGNDNSARYDFDSPPKIRFVVGKPLTSGVTLAARNQA